ncbi:MAG TPA: LysR family transcriptional regulator [Microvirga sp.]|jgi:DNA-binding transcriptional LysR family regulator|nr:LysR family transcriptional regulator [Microvirga sp.]
MDRLDELQILVAIAETGSLAAAARRLGRSAPAVTRGLAQLEGRVGLRLVERTTRRLAVTEAGRELAEQGRRILAEYEASLSAPSDAPLRGLVRVTAPLVFGRRHVTPVVASFLQRHPGIEVELVLHDRNLDLIEERLHVGVRIGSLKDSTLVARRVGAVRRVLVASPTYLARRGMPAAPEDLAEHDTILATGANPADEWTLGRAERRRTVRIAPRLRVNEIEAALVAVRAGHGIARVLSYQVFDDLADGRLVRILPDFEPDAIPVQLVVPNARAMAPKVRAFFDHAVQGLEGLPQIGPP